VSGALKLIEDDENGESSSPHPRSP